MDQANVSNELLLGETARPHTCDSQIALLVLDLRLFQNLGEFRSEVPVGVKTDSKDEISIKCEETNVVGG